MKRLAHTQQPRTSGSHVHGIRSFALAAIAVLALLALCSYPRPAGPSPTVEPTQPQRLSLELNLPAFRLEVRDSLTLVRSYTVAIGTRRYKTPTGEFEIARIVWNPWWFPPDAEWAAQDTVTPPGPKNPMGKVKLMFNGPYYLHGTPTVSSLGHAASHGCVRMRNEDAVDLALLVQPYGGLTVAQALTDTLQASWRKTRTFSLTNFIPVTIVYRSAEVRDSTLTLFPDVYRRHPKGLYPVAMTALADAGIDTSDVNRDVVRRLARSAASKSASLALHQLTTIVVEGDLAQ
ncbi:MAG: L,D-transpeptidase [Gemmatimonadota bacterium]